MATVEVNLQKVVDAKSTLKSSINAKLAIAGLNEIGSESISEYSGFINNIPVGSGYAYVKPGNVDYYSEWKVRANDGSIMQYDGTVVAQPSDVNVNCVRNLIYSNDSYTRTIQYYPVWCGIGTQVTITGTGTIMDVPEALEDYGDIEWQSPFTATDTITANSTAFTKSLNAISGTIGELSVTSINYTQESISGIGNRVKIKINFNASPSSISMVCGEFVLAVGGVKDFIAIVGSDLVSIDGNSIVILFAETGDGVYDMSGNQLAIQGNGYSGNYYSDKFGYLFAVDDSGEQLDTIGGIADELQIGTGAYARYMNIPSRN